MIDSPKQTASTGSHQQRYLVNKAGCIGHFPACGVFAAVDSSSVKLRCAVHDLSAWPPRLRSDNGSCYISGEFCGVLDQRPGASAHQAALLEENGIIERSNRTLREALEGEELSGLFQARDVLARIVRWYRAFTFGAGLPATDRLLPGRSGYPA
jgi:hypothetical protein